MINCLFVLGIPRKSMSPPCSRRTFLRVSGTTGVIAGAGCQSLLSARDTQHPAVDEHVPEGWPMARHDPGNTGHNPAGASPTDTVQGLWGAPDGTTLLHAPVVADGVAYLTIEEPAKPYSYFAAIDVASGEKRWSIERAVTTTPTVVGDSVYVGTTQGLQSLSVADGSERWTWTGRYDTFATPVVAFGVVIVTAGVVDPDDRALSIVALDADTGTAKWHYDDFRWQYDAERHDAAVGRVTTPPAIGDEGRVFAGASTDTIYAFDALTGEVLWTRNLPSSGPLIYDDGLVYASARVRDGPVAHRLWALDDRIGKTVWVYDVSEYQVLGPPAVANDTLYLSGSVGPPCDPDAPWNTQSKPRSGPGAGPGPSRACSGSNILFAINAKIGKTRWKTDLAAPAHAVAVGGEHVYALAESGVSVVDRSGTVVSHSELDADVRPAGPAIANGRVYLGWDERGTAHALVEE
jgi:outer membrane protein assembly factor BamB